MLLEAAPNRAEVHSACCAVHAARAERYLRPVHHARPREWPKRRPKARPCVDAGWRRRFKISGLAGETCSHVLVDYDFHLADPLANSWGRVGFPLLAWRRNQMDFRIVQLVANRTVPGAAPQHAQAVRQPAWRGSRKFSLAQVANLEACRCSE